MPIRTEPVLPEEDWQLRLEAPEDGSGIGVLTLDYPEKLNMWSWEATRQLGVLADRARFDDRIRVLLVKAEGRAFCAGVDLGMPEDRVTGRSPAEKVRNYYEGIRWVHERFRVFHELPQPIVAAVQGYCLGFGFELALMCDIRVAADDAIFALPEAQVGVSIDAGGDLRLAHEIGAGHAKLLALTGRRIDAAEAERLGIVQQVTTRDELVPTAAAIAAEIAANAPLAVQSIKRTIDAFAYRGLNEALRFEALERVGRVRERRHAGRVRRQGQEAASRIRGEVAAMGLPEPPPAGSAFLPADTFAGTTAIVTGAGTGLGRAIAVELARAGAAIGVVSRRRSTGWPGWPPSRPWAAGPHTPAPTSASPSRSPRPSRRWSRRSGRPPCSSTTPRPTSRCWRPPCDPTRSAP